MSSVELVLYEEEFQRLDAALKKLRQEANARAIFLIDKTGQQIAAAGRDRAVRHHLASPRSPPATSPPPTASPS